MIAWLVNIAAYLICAVAAVALARWVGSPVIIESLVPNLTTFVTALLAINVQTTAVIAVKLKELSEKFQTNLSGSFGQIRLAIYEQGFLLLLSLFIVALAKATAIKIPPEVVETGAMFTMLASLHIFMDTTIGLLIALWSEEGK